MKLTKKLKAEVLKFYKAYWDTYLNGDMKTLASMLDDNVTVVGTAVSEVFNNKKKTLKFYKATADQLVGKAQFRSRKIDLSAVDDTILIKEQCDFYVLLERKWTYYGHVRVTAIVKKTNKGLKLVQQHASFPDMKADEGEQLAAEKIKEENLQLRDAVKRRTIELEEKNQELEIEAALERVRTVAMSMRSSNELVSVCKVMNEELIKLGFDNIRNSQIAINNDDKQLYLNYEYSAYDGGSITDVAYNSHRKVRAMVNKMKGSKNAFFSVKITGKELNEWRSFRIKIGQKKDEKLAKAKAVCYYFYSVGNGALGISTFNAINKEQQLLLQKFRNVFVLAYKRFTDIQKAETQTRAAQIEVAVERVRAKALAMHRSDEIHEVVRELRNQLFGLKLEGIIGATICLKQADGQIRFWDITDVETTGRYGWDIVFDIDKIDPRLWVKKIWDSKKQIISTEQDSSDLKRALKWLGQYDKKTADEILKLLKINNIKHGWHRAVRLAHGRLITDFANEPPSEIDSILLKIGVAFDLAYQRFLDLQKAEAQTREAQIEAALERIRSVSMAMRTSNELFDIIRTVFGEWKKLGLELYECNINLLDREKKEWTNWGTGIGEAALPRSFLFPCFDDPFVNQLYEDTCKGISSRTYRIEGKAHRRFLDGMFAKTDFKNAPVEYREALYSIHRLYLTHAFMQYGSMDIVGPEAPPESTIEILKRFAKVFEQAYTRYLDVIKAEVQAREAQIELGLERVRARAMAMQKSDELRQVVTVLFQQIKSLGFDAFMSTIILFDKRTMNYDCLMASNVQSELPHIYHVPYFENRFMKIFTGAFSEEVPYKVLELSGQDKEDYDRYLLTKTDFKKLPDETKQMMKSVKACQLCCAYMAYGCIEAIGNEPLNNNDAFTLQRFAKVFEQTYTRFLDLQKAEEQTREAQIELGLERVRARAMAMQNSDELKELIGAVFIELTKLDLVLTRCLIMIFDPKTNGSTWWMANSEAPSDPIGLYIKYHEHSPYAAYINAWQERKNKWQYILEGKDKKEWDEFLFVETELSQLPEFVIAGMKAPDRVYLSCSFNNFGCLNLASLEPLSDEHFDILLRFAKVFDLTYTRFNDLKQAEAQAKEAKIQLALERVRARTMAMQRSDELSETSFVLFEQFKKLGLTADQISIGIIKEEEGYIEMSATVHGNQLQQIIKISLDEPFAIKKMLRAWKDKERSLVINIQGNELEQYNIYRNKISGTSLFPEKANEEDHWIINAAFFSKGFLSFSTYEPQPNETIELLERFASVFDLTYTRFLDLKQAEAQAKESQIQLALERVRARTMAMQHSNELSETASLLFDQLKSLGEIPERTFIGVFNESEWVIEIWATQHGGSQMDMLVKATIDEPHVMNRMYKAWKEQKKSIVIDLKGEELESYFQFLKAKGAPVKREIFGDRRLENIAFFSKGMLGIITTEPATTESIQLYERFANAFDLTYTRFLDLKKAEAQAREAQIETALERVRSKTMAMQRSEELDSVIKTVYSELKHLDVSFARCFIMIFDEQKGATWWMGSPDDDLFHEGFYVQYHTHPPHLAYLKGWEERQQKWEYRLEGQIKKNWDEFVFNQTGLSKLPPIVIQDMKSFEFAQLSASFENFGCMTTGGPERLSEKSFDILSRFTKVFDQTYTRFNDLKQAEAQARESQIQLALERVRARTMAMQHSDELKNAAALLFQQAKALGVPAYSCGYNIWEKDEKEFTSWMSTQDGSDFNAVHNISLTEDANFIRFAESRQKGEQFFVLELRDERMQEHYEYLKTIPAFKAYFDYAISVGFDLPKTQIHHIANFSQGNLLFITLEPCLEFHDVFKRFAAVFEQTYTRFLDLQKAEAQAREAQIELGLERVRARAMAMQKSDELSELVDTVFKELTKLHFTLDRCIIIIVDEKSMSANYWMANPESITPTSYRLQLKGIPYLEFTFNAWKERKIKAVYDLRGDEKADTVKYIFSKTELMLLPEVVKAGMKNTDRIFLNASFNNFGGLQADTLEPLSDDNLDILYRFSKVFDLTYTRFNDLQKAEAQARESQIQLALERVRARTMAMQKSDELAEVASLLFTQIADLGTNSWSSGFIIFQPDELSINSWMSKPDGSMGVPFNIPVTEDPFFIKIYEAYKRGEEFFVMESRGKELEETYKYMFSLPGAAKALGAIEDLGFQMPAFQVTHCVFFPTGFLMFITYEPCQEMWEIFKRFGKVFQQTYTRFLDLQKAEAQAREAQIQLSLERVRARAMAMYNSDELNDVLSVLFEQFDVLGINPSHAILSLVDLDTNTVVFRLTGKAGKRVTAKQIIDLNAMDIWKEIVERWKKDGPDVINLIHYPKEVLPQVWEIFSEVINAIPEDARIKVEDFPDGMYNTEAYCQFGYIGFCHTRFATEEEKNILTRFATEFGRLYQRFLDLQKAEAQARESQIQLALERVRARTMAMQKSDELADTAQLLYREFRTLDITTLSCGYSFINEKKNTQTVWTVLPDGTLVPDFIVFPLTGDDVLDTRYKDWKKKKQLHTYEIRGEANKEHHRFLSNYVPSFVVEDIFSKLPDRIVFHCANFSVGYLFILATEFFQPDDQQTIVRFANVFEQTYTRFLDLQKAEAQAREAQIEAALERVRSTSLAMHHSDELEKVVVALFDKLVELGLSFDGAFIYSFEKEKRNFQIWVATKLLSTPIKVNMPYDEEMSKNKIIEDLWNSVEKGKDIINKFYSGKAKNDYFSYAAKHNEAKISGSVTKLQLDAERWIVSLAAEKNSVVGFDSWTGQVTTNEDFQVLKRFAKVFEQAYTRFLDLQKAEAQAREAQIEATLERVRAKTMAMHKSEELHEVNTVIIQQIKTLSIRLYAFGIHICHVDEPISEAWMGDPIGGYMPKVIYDHSYDPLSVRMYAGWKEGKILIEEKLSGDALKEHFSYMITLVPDRSIFDNMVAPESLVFHFAYFKYGFFVFLTPDLCPEEHSFFKRLAKVFEQTYTRFLDLQKAEANAREAQIEAGLERVRARTMAMHSSDDVSIATATMFTELEKLGIEYLRGGITNIMANRTQEVWSVNNVAEGKIVKAVGTFQIDDHPFWQLMYKDWQAKKEFLYYYLAGTEKENYIKILSTAQNYLPQILQQFPDVHFHVYFFGEGALWTNSLKPHTEEEKQIMKRFTSVFSLTFRRYQDLKKAEAQAREAQIEAALEKVRASTMAMQKSEDLSQAAFVLFKQFKELGESPERIFIATFDSADENLVDLWGTNQGGNQLDKLFRVSANEPTVIKKIVDAWKEKKSSVVIDLTGADLKNYLQFLESTGIPVTYGVMTERRVQTVACFSKGVIGVTTPEPRPAASIQLLERFANVFDLTYTRFLDLLQAEAQAREATIEAALEKVRGKAMAMHNSDDLSVTTSMIITELRRLGINPIRCGVGIIDKETHKGQLYTATTSPEGDNLSVVGWVLLQGHHVLESIYQKWVDGEDYFPELTGESMRHYYEQLLAGLSVPLPDFSDEQKHYGHFFAVSVGCLYAWSDKKYNDDEIKILKRFATIIDLTFRRYFELQKSEANAREAVKQAALDRVRADIASMRTVNDLDRITPLIWNELTILGIPFIRCGVFIMDESQQLIHTFLSTPDGKAIAAFHLPYDTPGNISKVIDGWRHKKIYVDHWGEEEFVQFADILMKQGALVSRENYLKTIPQRGFHLHFLPFLQGMLYVGNTEKLNEEEIELIQHLADAFSTAYARYEDFNKLEAAKQQVERTLTDLKQAQQQLVQSEKMASLGELTAGIAHEIQNPLNFVNNFSDVSNELLEEMKIELEKGNKDDAIAIVEDVKQNLEKILHHGKRADAIVKGMLQHSRTSSGQKEMTDINILADEYLRLAYHGLRAKDKTFNAKFETHFDNSIEKINIIPQDIGRVILNLINNAFYTVTEKKKQNQNGYEPTVTVTTLKDNGKIEIKVRDNGNGIPQKVLDKIFQPFFTTKPTGQGTGLGLSLAYDIVTKGHGGELKVETKEGDGSEFIIQLPTN